VGTPVTVAIARRIVATPVLLLPALFAWLAAGAWPRPLALPDEGRYVGVAWEMLRSGNWLVPTLDTLPYFHKPPLFYWLTAASLAVFGINDWAARLPSLLAATGSAFALYLFARRFVGEFFARVPLLILVTTPFFLAGAQFANLDMLVSACICCSVLAAAHAVLTAEDDRPHRATLALAYVFAALGMLAKGLIGVVIPGLVMTAWLVHLRRPATLLRLVWLPGVVLFVLLVVPWFALVAQRYPAFLHYFFIHHHLKRYTTTDFNGHQPFWFYLPVLAGLTLPWFVFLPRALSQRAGKDGAPPSVHALMWIWLLVTLVFFSIPQSKLLGYALVAVPPMAVLFAHGLARFAGTREAMWQHGVRVTALGAAMCGATLVADLVYERNNVRSLFAEVSPLIAAEDEIVALRSYPFSLSFYLRLRRPIRVVEDWDQPLLMRKDSWRRELMDAEAFVDPRRVSALFIKPADLTRALACARSRVFLIGEERSAAAFPALARLRRVGDLADEAVWLSPPRAGGEAEDCGS
jgi:4-amino-4-deoxy-L-arabinose transferase-like glycosyltransferase